MSMEEAAEAFENYTGLTAEEWIEINVPDLQDVVFLGLAARLEYDGIISGKDKPYFHDFKDDPPVFLFGVPEGKILLIYGEGIKLTARGIFG